MNRARSITLLLIAGLLATALSCDRIYQRPGVWCERDSDCASLHCEVAYNTCLDAGDGSTSGDGAVDLAPACTPASAAADCVDPGAPICASAACRACTGPTDDAACAARSAATPVCAPTGPSAGRCVACRPSAPIVQSSACAATTPVCGSDGACRACASHAECSSGICIRDGAQAGSCAPAADVALVDNGGQDPATCKLGRVARDGTTAATAYCDLTEVIPTTRPYALVRGSAQPYSALTLTNRSITIVGPGPAATPTARIFANLSASVNVSMTSGRSDVILDGLSLGGDINANTPNGLFVSNSTGTDTNANVIVRNSTIQYCSQACVSTTTATLTITSSTISHATMAGVSTSGGTVTLVRCTLQGNTGGGLSINGSVYRVENNLIAGNGLAGAGVLFSGNVTGTFWFNTIVGNQTSSGVGAVNCGGAASPPLLQASIFWNNAKAVSGASTLLCTLSYSDLDDSPLPAGTGNFSQLPLFLDAVGYRLQPTSPCKDKVQLAELVGTSPPTFDIDAAPRPAGVAYDIGCDEL